LFGDFGLVFKGGKGCVADAGVLFGNSHDKISIVFQKTNSIDAALLNRSSQVDFRSVRRYSP